MSAPLAMAPKLRDRAHSAAMLAVLELTAVSAGSSRRVSAAARKAVLWQVWACAGETTTAEALAARAGLDRSTTTVALRSLREEGLLIKRHRWRDSAMDYVIDVDELYARTVGRA